MHKEGHRKQWPASPGYGAWHTAGMQPLVAFRFRKGLLLWLRKADLLPSPNVHMFNCS